MVRQCLRCRRCRMWWSSCWRWSGGRRQSTPCQSEAGAWSGWQRATKPAPPPKAGRQAGGCHTACPRPCCCAGQWMRRSAAPLPHRWWKCCWRSCSRFQEHWSSSCSQHRRSCPWAAGNTAQRACLTRCATSRVRGRPGWREPACVMPRVSELNGGGQARLNPLPLLPPHPAHRGVAGRVCRAAGGRRPRGAAAGVCRGLGEPPRPAQPGSAARAGRLPLRAGCHQRPVCAPLPPPRRAGAAVVPR